LNDSACNRDPVKLPPDICPPLVDNTRKLATRIDKGGISRLAPLELAS